MVSFQSSLLCISFVLQVLERSGIFPKFHLIVDGEDLKLMLSSQFFCYIFEIFAIGSYGGEANTKVGMHMF